MGVCFSRFRLYQDILFFYVSTNNLKFLYFFSFYTSQGDSSPALYGNRAEGSVVGISALEKSVVDTLVAQV